MSHSRRSKSQAPHHTTAESTPPPVPKHRVGDLLWCRENKKRYSLWWPAMVTYEPHQAILARITPRGIPQVHVQYFGISAIRGWVSQPQYEPLVDATSRKLPTANIGKKMKCEFEVAIREASEALRMTHKERKLKFIFNFDPVPSTPATNHRQVKTEGAEEREGKGGGDVSVRREVEEEGGSRVRSEGRGGAEPTMMDKRRRSKRRRNSSSPSLSPMSLQRMRNEVVPVSLRTSTRRGRRVRSCSSSGGDTARDFVVSFSVNGLGAASGSLPSLLISESPVTMDSFAVTVDTVLNEACTSEGGKEGELFPEKPPNGVVISPPPTRSRGPGRPRTNSTVDTVLNEACTAESSQSFPDKPPNGSLISPPPTRSRGPGRPRKNPTVLNEACAEYLPDKPPNGVVVSPPTTKRRGPGRPRKNSAVDTVLNEACTSEKGRESGCLLDRPPNGVVIPPPLTRRGPGRPRKDSTARQNFRHAPPLGKRASRSRRRASVGCEVLFGPPLVKRLALDPGSESGSETSGVSIASAILTPPSSGTEAAAEDDRGSVEGAQMEEEVEEEEHEKPLVPEQTKTKTDVDLPEFRDGECAICDARESGLLVCQGHCLQAFHIDCLGLVAPPSFQFVCDECQAVPKTCFTCSGSTGPLEVCAKPRCGKFYHRSCIYDDRLFVFDDLKTKFTCPLHSCAKCVGNDLGTAYSPRGSTLVQCVKCPLTLHKPHCLVAGCNILSSSQMICYLHISIECELNLYKHLNMDTCLECGESGSLYCCDFCSSAYHRECMEEHHMPMEEGERRGRGVGSTEKWICPACRDHDLPTYNSVVLCKFGIWRWWPGQVVPMDDVPDNIMKKQPGGGMFVVRFFGTNDYCWIHHGRTLSISLEPGAEPAKEVNKMCRNHGKKRAHTDKVFKKACEEAMDMYMEQVKLQEKSKPLPKQESKAYTKIKINKYLVPRPTISDDDLHSLPCQCTPESPCDDDSICVNRAIHVECDPKTCPVGLFCHNQKMRRFQYANTVPFYAGNRGWGLRAASDIREGDFVVEYVGEVLDMEMCRERLRKAHETQTQHFYMLTLDSRNGLVIDAKEKSNHARFINHSCDPNCETQKWTVGHESRVGIFAKKDIKAGTELTFDYQLDSLGNGKKECLCGSRNCSGFIGVRSKVEPKPKPKPKVKKKPKPPAPQKPRLPLPAVEETHENECFICGDGGDLLCCDFGKCCKVYHLHCIGRKLIPPEQWVCPHHYCTICSKRAFVFCSSCPISYCGKHRRNKLVDVNGEPKCESCLSDSKKEEEGKETTVSIPLTSASNVRVASKPATPSSVKVHSMPHPPSLPVKVLSMSPPCLPAKVPSTPPPPSLPAKVPSTPPSSFPCFPTLPSSPPLPPLAPPALPPLPSISPLSSLSHMHHTLSSLPVLTHPLGRHPLHPLSHHPIQLLMPPSNHFFYLNSPQPFLSSPPSSLVYPSTYHH